MGDEIKIKEDEKEEKHIETNSIHVEVLKREKNCLTHRLSNLEESLQISKNEASKYKQRSERLSKKLTHLQKSEKENRAKTIRLENILMLMKENLSKKTMEVRTLQDKVQNQFPLPTNETINLLLQANKMYRKKAAKRDSLSSILSKNSTPRNPLDIFSPFSFSSDNVSNITKNDTMDDFRSKMNPKRLWQTQGNKENLNNIDQKKKVQVLVKQVCDLEKLRSRKPLQEIMANHKRVNGRAS